MQKITTAHEAKKIGNRKEEIGLKKEAIIKTFNFPYLFK